MLRHSLILFAFIALAGCAGLAPLIPLTDEQFVVKASDKPIIRLAFPKVRTSSEDLVDHIHRIAERECGGDDYEYKVDAVFSRKQKPEGGEPFRLVRAGTAVVYCNTLFVDSRESQPDSIYEYVMALPDGAFDVSPYGPLQLMLLSGQFDELTQSLDQLNESFDGSVESERRLSEVIEGFSIVDSRLTAALERWANDQPQSAWPTLMLAKHKDQIAWLHRGSGTAETVTKDGWVHFEASLNSAMSNVELTEEAGLKLPHVDAMRIAALRGTTTANRREAILEAFENARRRWPTSSVVHEVFAWAITERWFGKPGELDKLVAELRGNPDAKQALAGVLATIHYDKALTTLSDEKVEEALEHVTQSIGYSPNTGAYRIRAEILAAQNRQVSAEKSAEMAVQLSPYSHGLRLKLAELSFATGNVVQALTSVAWAAALKPDDAKLQELKGHYFFNMRRYREAAAAFRAAAAAGGDVARLVHLSKSAEFQLKVRAKEAPADSADNAVRGL